MKCSLCMDATNVIMIHSNMKKTAKTMSNILKCTGASRKVEAGFKVTVYLQLVRSEQDMCERGERIN